MSSITVFIIVVNLGQAKRWDFNMRPERQTKVKLQAPLVI